VTHRPDAGGGGLTGATGDLTPDATDAAFDPGERREVESAEHQADVTRARAHHGPTGTGATDSPNAERGSRDRDARMGGDELADHEEHF
jgi:hypothetical protein